MAIKTIIFDLDDTLLFDQKSVKTAFEKTCQYASEQKNVDAIQLEEAVRKEARALYEGYDTYDYTVLIGINPFEGLWGSFGRYACQTTHGWSLGRHSGVWF